MANHIVILYVVPHLWKFSLAAFIDTAIIRSIQAMIVQFVVFMGTVIICFSGLFFTLWTLGMRLVFHALGSPSHVPYFPLTSVLSPGFNRPSRCSGPLVIQYARLVFNSNLAWQQLRRLLQSFKHPSYLRHTPCNNLRGVFQHSSCNKLSTMSLISAWLRRFFKLVSLCRFDSYYAPFLHANLIRCSSHFNFI